MILFILIPLLIYAGIYVFEADSLTKWFWLGLAVGASIGVVVFILNGNWASASITSAWVIYYLIRWDKEKNSN